MKLRVNGKEAYFTTSGREIDKDQPTIVFVHGSGLTHVTWVLQTRYFAFHGYNTIAVDLPGHGDSEGLLSRRVLVNRPLLYCIHEKQSNESVKPMSHA